MSLDTFFYNAMFNMIYLWDLVLLVFDVVAYLKRAFTLKWKVSHLLLTLVSFQTRKTYVHGWNTNYIDIFD